MAGMPPGECPIAAIARTVHVLVVKTASIDLIREMIDSHLRPIGMRKVEQVEQRRAENAAIVAAAEAGAPSGAVPPSPEHVWREYWKRWPSPEQPGELGGVWMPPSPRVPDAPHDPDDLAYQYALLAAAHDSACTRGSKHEREVPFWIEPTPTGATVEAFMVLGWRDLLEAVYRPTNRPAMVTKLQAALERVKADLDKRAKRNRRVVIGEAERSAAAQHIDSAATILEAFSAEVDVVYSTVVGNERRCEKRGYPSGGYAPEYTTMAIWDAIVAIDGAIRALDIRDAKGDPLHETRIGTWEGWSSWRSPETCRADADALVRLGRGIMAWYANTIRIPGGQEGNNYWKVVPIDSSGWAEKAAKGARRIAAALRAGVTAVAPQPLTTIEVKPDPNEATQRVAMDEVCIEVRDWVAGAPSRRGWIVKQLRKGLRAGIKRRRRKLDDFDVADAEGVAMLTPARRLEVAVEVVAALHSRGCIDPVHPPESKEAKWGKIGVKGAPMAARILDVRHLMKKKALDRMSVDMARQYFALVQVAFAQAHPNSQGKSPAAPAVKPHKGASKVQLPPDLDKYLPARKYKPGAKSWLYDNARRERGPKLVRTIPLGAREHGYHVDDVVKHQPRLVRAEYLTDGARVGI